MNRSEFRAALESLDADDQDGLVEAIRQRVSALSGRHLDIQQQINESDEKRQDLQTRLAAVEGEIVSQVNDSVDLEVETIEDVENLPSDANVQFDPELIEEVERIRSEARDNYQQTSAEGSDLQAELNANTEELELYGQVLADVEDGHCTTSEARDRLLEHLQEE